MPTEIEIQKFARLLCDEADATTIELGLATPESFVPFDSLPEEAKAVYFKMAAKVMARISWDSNTGKLVVLDEIGRIL